MNRCRAGETIGIGETAMQIEMRKLSEIKPYERNPRINDNAVDAVAASIQEFGFRQAHRGRRPRHHRLRPYAVAGRVEAGAAEGSGPRCEGPDAGENPRLPDRRQ